ncbi:MULTISPECIES: FadR/GntR family transcriptional regulator [unclassified Paenibacillus]|uniref:FadR/GntR family transcriptional regulator n=1 Tax=unclassified Paenibacillus TaxID=185978 RepID=UPI001AE3347F|nr:MULTISPECIES: FadR/GntR family transcriptional regulator [unclassified Paenibacillus]MBP1155612.1 DNA-binding FadR family transcriptional regulator [Paenibacillus sp. PvP091]MBP1169002.1 DNA-binding FadR family transcriptional regulator [Paenibacillus sp. PvR098]MBP2440030.1 DNA-binding FadR family transcriptional regulator [Paenibacillus sp. PvP052]
MGLKRASRTTLVEQVVAQMELLIESGTWPVGLRIPAEPDLVRQLGVSRNTVREAVKSLVHAGLLIARPGDGTYVCSSSVLGAVLLRRLRRSSIDETLEVRFALEQEAARLAAVRRTAEDIERLRRSLDEFDAASENKDIEGYVQADLNLHKMIIAAAHNSVLTELYEHITEGVRVSIGSVLDHSVLMEPHIKIHRDLVQAIIDQDPEYAAEAVRAYIEASRHILQGDKREE